MARCFATVCRANVGHHELLNTHTYSKYLTIINVLALLQICSANRTDPFCVSPDEMPNAVILALAEGPSGNFFSQLLELQLP